MRLLVSLLAFIIIVASPAAKAEPQWMTLPPTPELPAAKTSGLAPINGVNIWYATFGTGEPVILVHGGLANSDYWGEQVRALAPHYQVVVMDSRGHVGWSDGAIIGLDIAMKHPERMTKLFAFAANSDPSGVADISSSKVFNDYIARAEKEYQALSPTPDQYKSFLDQISAMWASQPNWTADNLRTIKVPTWIVDGDHDEAIKRENTEFMAANIPNAGLLLQPEVSHFSFIQDSKQFNEDLLHFLEHVKGQ